MLPVELELKTEPDLSLQILPVVEPLVDLSVKAEIALLAFTETALELTILEPVTVLPEPLL